MKKYSDNLLLEFLMFSNDVENEILDFSVSLLQIDINSIYEKIKFIEDKNIYTEHNIENLKKTVTFLKDKLDNYEDIMLILSTVKPSNDIYYYEYLEKFEILKKTSENEYIGISKEYLEKSIRFDYYAFRILILNEKDYDETLYSILINNPLFSLFINILLNENPAILLNKVIKKRIEYILISNDIKLKDEIKYNEQLLKKINYFNKNKKAEVFDYEMFNYYQNQAFFEFLITSNIPLKGYHNYITSEKFLCFLEEYIYSFDNEEGRKLFSYDNDMNNRFKLIITYILRENEKNEVKIRCNNLLSTWLSYKFEDNIFYQKEAISKLSLKECICYQEDVISYMKLFMKCDYQIFETYSLNEEEFNEIIKYISPEYFVGWMRKMLFVNVNFFRNEFLRERTNKILQELSLNEEYQSEIKKMKKKLKKINKGLE